MSEQLRPLSRRALSLTGGKKCCSHDPACDSFENYSITVSVDELALSFNFAHRDIHLTPMENIPFEVTFGCVARWSGPSCVSGAHRYD